MPFHDDAPFNRITAKDAVLLMRCYCCTATTMMKIDGDRSLAAKKREHHW